MLFDDDDVGLDKVERAARRLTAEGATVETVRGRFLPDGALALAEAHDVIVEGADNFATKFLVADAGAITATPVVHAGAVRWSGWALATVPGSACLRCVFEDIPRDRVETCAEAGVIGPVVGLLGALEAALCVRVVTGDARVGGELWRYDGRSGRVRATRAERRAGCPACEGLIRDVAWERYAPAECESRI